MLVGLWTAACSPVLAQEPVTVTLLQDSGSPPYMMATIDGPAGIYADIVKEADRRLPAFTIELVPMAWPDALLMTENGSAAGLVGVYYRPTTRPWIRHYSQPLYDENVAVFCRRGVKGSNWRFPEDYASLTFTNNLGFAAPGTAFFDMVRDGRINLIEEQSTAENLRLVHLGRADCYVQAELAAVRVLRTNGFDNIEKADSVLIEPAYIGYSDKFTGDSADVFIATMDEVLAQMTSDGTIERIVRENTVRN